jgi:hypothetical protein
MAQNRQSPALDSASTNSIVNETANVPEVPGLSGLLRGFNGGLTVAGFHDASTGWATLLQPAVGYNFNDLFALDITVPIFSYRLTESLAANPKPTALLIPERCEVGDTIIGLHLQFVGQFLGYEGTVSMTAPTGDETHGLSTGRVTFDFSNLFQHTFRHITPTTELGVGDSVSLVNRLVNKNYTTLGPIGHFQLGFAIPLLHGIIFETNAYEILPIGDQKIYQSVVRRGTRTLIVTGHNVTEDNGFTSSLDVPVDRHTTLSAYYNRSIRQHDDTVSVALTWVLRGAKQESTDKPVDDIVLRSLSHDPTPPPVLEPPEPDDPLADPDILPPLSEETPVTHPPTVNKSQSF